MEKDPEKAFIITYYDYLFFTAWFLKDEATYKFLDLQIKHAFLSGIEHRKTVYIENWSEFHKILYEKVNE
jgi:hypothetical protein